ncbi:glycosyltransferase family 8 protein [Planomonospora sphaerica]|uniref:glycosyltransferase family 8 protein n=1 Tax=Planomonospora sphaerica TaxID=161355 RepID=UPI00083A88DA|nr:glycosyltransferase family 8 protein [Planomonospora sphaerica]
MTTVRVAFVSDVNYVIPLAAAVRSVIDNAAAPEDLEIAVLCHDIPVDTKKALTESWRPGEIDVRLLDIDLTMFSRFPAREYFNSTVYARLIYHRLLPTEWDRVISLDSDMIVRGDLTALYETDLRGRPLAAAREPYSPVVSWKRGVNRWRELGLPPHAPYFNAGMMVLDLDRWRHDAVGERAIAHGARHADVIQQQEQECLNAILAGEWTEVEQIWNMGPYWRFPQRRVGRYRNVWREGRIRHFVGIYKPWMAECRDMEDADEFYQYVDRTAWKGWRPGLPADREQAR